MVYGGVDVQLRSLLTCRTLEWSSGQPNYMQYPTTSEKKTVWTPKSSQSCRKKKKFQVCAENRTKFFAYQARTAVTTRPIYLQTSLPKGYATYMKKYGTLFFYLITTNRRLYSHVIWQQCYRLLLSYFMLVLSLSLTCFSYLKMAAGWHTCCWSQCSEVQKRKSPSCLYYSLQWLQRTSLRSSSQTVQHQASCLRNLCSLILEGLVT